MDAMLDATSAHSSRAAVATPPAQQHQSLAARGLLALPGDVLSRILDFVENDSEDAFFERTEIERRCRGGEVEAVRLSEFLSEKSARSWQAAVEWRRGQAATQTAQGAGSGTLALRSVGKALRCLLDSYVSTLSISVVFDNEGPREQVLGCLHARLVGVMPLWSGLARVDLTVACRVPKLSRRNFPGSDLQRTLAVIVANCPNLVRLKLKLHLLPTGSSNGCLSGFSFNVLSSLTRLEDLFMEASRPLVLYQEEDFPTLLSVQRLSLQLGTISRESGYLIISPQPALVDLHLRFLSTDLRHLASSTRLRVLSLHDVEIRGHRPQVLQEFPSLEQLHLFRVNSEPLLDLQAAPPSLTRLVIVNKSRESVSDISTYVATRIHLQSLWLESLSPPQGLDFQRQTLLTELSLCDVEVRALDLSCLSNLMSLTMKRIRSSRRPRLPCPCSLAFLEVEDGSIQSIDLEFLSSLKTLRLASRSSWLEVRNLGHLMGLTSLRLGPDVEIELVEELVTLRSLQRLVLEALDMPLVWPDFSIHSDLQHLELVGLRWESDPMRAPRLATSLRILEIQGCTRLGALDLSNQVCLQSLFLDMVPSLTEMKGLERVTGLRILSIVRAEVRAPTLAPLRGLRFLEKINIQECRWLRDTTSLAALSRLAR